MNHVCLKNGVVVATFATKEEFISSGMAFSVDYDTLATTMNQITIGHIWKVEDSLSDIELTKYLCDLIDSYADAARLSVAGDSLRAVEYQKAAQEARDFAYAGYPPESVPRTVQAWAVNGRSAQQAADDIIIEAQAYEDAFYLIRDTRLTAKEQVRASVAAGDRELVLQFVGNVKAALMDCVVGIGNNR